MRQANGIDNKRKGLTGETESDEGLKRTVEYYCPKISSTLCQSLDFLKDKINVV